MGTTSVSTTCEQICNNLSADLLQLVHFCTCLYTIDAIYIQRYLIFTLVQDCNTSLASVHYKTAKLNEKENKQPLALKKEVPRQFGKLRVIFQRKWSPIRNVFASGPL